MQRGEIWWANLPKPYGKRPVLLVSRDKAIQVLSNVTVAPITTLVRDIPTEVLLAPSDGLPRKCAANMDALLTVPKSCMSERIAALSKSKLQAVARALQFALGA